MQNVQNFHHVKTIFHVSKMQYLFLKIYKFLEVLVCIQNL